MNETKSNQTYRKLFLCLPSSVTQSILVLQQFRPRCVTADTQHDLPNIYVSIRLVYHQLIVRHHGNNTNNRKKILLFFLLVCGSFCLWRLLTLPNDWTMEATRESPPENTETIWRNIMCCVGSPSSLSTCCEPLLLHSTIGRLKRKYCNSVNYSSFGWVPLLFLACCFVSTWLPRLVLATVKLSRWALSLKGTPAKPKII